MRKLVLGVLVAVMIGGAFQQVQAQEKKAQGGLNLGVMSFGGGDEDGFGVWTFGLAMDYPMGKNVIFSPEVEIWTYRFYFDAFVLSPGMILNYQEGTFFFGAGLIYPIAISEFGTAHIGLLPKVNIGFIEKHVKLTVYAFSNWALSGMFLGASIGYRF